MGMRALPPAVEALAGLLAGFLGQEHSRWAVAIFAVGAGAAWLVPRARAGRILALAACLGAACAARWQSTPREDDLSIRVPDDSVRASVEGVVRESDPPGPDSADLVVDATAWTTAE